jgi:hypothetical protein
MNSHQLFKKYSAAWSSLPHMTLVTSWNALHSLCHLRLDLTKHIRVNTRGNLSEENCNQFQICTGKETLQKVKAYNPILPARVITFCRSELQYIKFNHRAEW